MRDWNVLAAWIQASQPTAAGSGTSLPAAALPSGAAGAAIIPVITMQDLVLFPHMTLSIFVGRDDTRRGVEFAMAADRRVLVVAQRHNVENDPNTRATLYPVGVIASVINRQTQVDGVLKVSISGVQRTGIVRLIDDEFLKAEVAPIAEARGQSAEAGALSRAVLDAYQVYANVDFSSPPSSPRARHGLPSIGDPSLLADTVAPLLSIGIEKMQQLLATSDVVTRLEAILELLNASRPAT